MPAPSMSPRPSAMPLLVLALGAALLAGCTDEATPVPALTSPAAATSTPTPSPTPEPAQPPAPPAAMATNDEAGAVAAAQYFIVDLYPYMFASGDMTQFAALADDGCIFCNSVLTKAEESASRHRTAVAGPSTVVSVESVTRRGKSVRGHAGTGPGRLTTHRQLR